ncbi:MAG: LTA synthase family protein [Lawsonibacter sp.]|nr:LTA synthase family protein [Lawsonibacter sp.]
MSSYAYSGKRVSGGHGASGREGTKRTHTLGRILFFPVLFLYLELVLHVSMGAALGYAPIFVLFSVAAGFLFSALTQPFPRRVNRFLTKVFALAISLIYVVEMIAKKILQSYYPLSTLGTAAGNRLTDYTDVVLSTVVRSSPMILVLFLPVILLFLFGKRVIGFDRFDVRFSGIILALAVVFHLLSLGAVNLPWKGDLIPKQLYQMDTNIDDQVEQLGLWTMLRLDIQHMIIPVKNDLDADFSGIGELGDQSSTPAGSGAASSEAGSEENPGPVIDTSPNVLNVDLSKLADGAKNDDIKWLCNYFNSVTPTKKNEYTGMFKGYNVIQLVIEGFSGYVIDPELTPTLYKLTHEGFVFQNFYTALHYTSTSNGECQTLLGLYPKNGNPITMKRTGELKTNCYFSLAQQLGREGYEVKGYHGNYDMYGRLASHTNLGYDFKQYQSGLDLEMSSSGKLLWPQRDSYVVESSVDDYINSDQPFHVYYMTISGHMPYSNNRIVQPYLDTVRALPYSETTQNYIATAMEVDKSLKILLDKLEAAGKLDKTLIVATGDHIPYFNVDTLEELSGKKFGSSDDLEKLNESNIDFDVYKNSLIIWSASMEQPVDVDKVCCQVDILPTISNLLGLPYDSRMLAGSDILSDSEGLVIFTSRSWKSDKGFYNRFTQKFTPASGVSMTPEEQESYVTAMKKLVGYKLDSTPLIIENNFYNYVFGKG